MRKHLLIITLILSILLISACTRVPSTVSEPQPTDSTPSTPSESQPATPIPNALTADEIAELQEIYKTYYYPVYEEFYNIALGQTYTDPREIDLGLFFTGGDRTDWSASDEELEFIRNNIQNSEYLDTFRSKPENMDAILQMCFGLSLCDMKGNGLDYLTYFDETGCYYNNTGSRPRSAEFLEITGGLHLDDGNLKVYYTANNGSKYVTILKPVEGGYHILSNLEIVESSDGTTELTALAQHEIAQLQNIFQLVLTEDLIAVPNFYNTALGLEYSDPRDIPLSYFFRQGDYSDFDNTVMTDEEYAFLKANDKNAEFLDWYRISSQDVERVLQMCFGISLADMNNDDISRLLYWEDTDCYYSGTTSPAPYAMNLEITGGVHLDDGNLKVYYTTQETKDGEVKQFVMILKPVDGGYHILSNLEVKE